MSGVFKKQLSILVVLGVFTLFFSCYTVVVPPAQYRTTVEEDPEYIEDEYVDEYYDEETGGDIYNYYYMDPWDMYGYDPFFWDSYYYSPWSMNMGWGYPRWGGYGYYSYYYNPYRYANYYDPYGYYWYSRYNGYYSGYYSYYNPMYGGFYDYYSTSIKPYKKRDFAKRREVTRGNSLGSAPTSIANTRSNTSVGTVSNATSLGKRGVSNRSVSRARPPTNSGSSSISSNSRTSKSSSSRSVRSSSSRSRTSTGKRTIKRSPPRRTGGGTATVKSRSSSAGKTSSSSGSKTTGRTVKKKKKVGGGGISSNAGRSIEIKTPLANRNAIPEFNKRFIERLRTGSNIRTLTGSRSSGNSYRIARSSNQRRAPSYGTARSARSGRSVGASIRSSGMSSGRSVSSAGSRSVSRSSSSGSRGGRTVIKRK